MRPGPSRPCAISKPRPGPRITFDAGSRTFVKLTSPWPDGSSYALNTGSIRSIRTPGASSGHSTIVCRRCGSACGSVSPMKITTRASG
ncbi:hypothetical protein DM75_1834 [Burkholderia mallei]|nr:hypothetical protein DM75_1834 [Burkholderia mallei]